MSVDLSEGGYEAGEDDQNFKYPPFTSSGQEIRLLQFAPGLDSTSPVALSIQIWPFPDAPPYSALSYTWGPPEPQSSILVNEHTMRVREHCLFALRQLCSVLQPSAWFWIDAICINQEDVDEKNTQVQFMGEIYRNAMDVIVSLGDHDDSSRILFDLFQDMELKMSHEHDARREGQPNSEGFGDRMFLNPENPTGDDDSPPWYRWFQGLSFARARELLEMLWQFAQRPYWRRMWILQETMLAGRARLLCGFTVVEWNTHSLFCADVFSSVSLSNDIPWTGKTTSEAGKHIINLIRKPGHGPPKELSPSEQAAERFQELKRNLSYGIHAKMSSLLRNRSVGEWKPKSEHLPHILKVNRDGLCSDPRDRVYGLLHLVRGKPEIQVDYRLSALQIGIAAIKYFGPKKNWDMANPLHFDYETDFLLGDYVPLLRQQLGISRQSEEFTQITMSRLGLALSASNNGHHFKQFKDSEISSVFPHERPQLQVIDPNFIGEKCSTITRGQDGKLSAALEVYSSDWSDLMEVMTAYDELDVNRSVADCISLAQKLDSRMPPLPLHGTLVKRGNRQRKGVIVGLCSGNTQEGDVLARPINKNDMLYALILRPFSRGIVIGYEEDIYEIVGEAILVRGCENKRSGCLKVPGRVTNAPPYVAFVMCWGIEDAFFFYSRESDELKRAILHDQDSGTSWSVFEKNKPVPLPAVPADFVESGIRLITNVTRRRLSSFAIANAALGEAPDGEDVEGQESDQEQSNEESDEDESDQDIERIARVLVAILEKHGSVCHR